MLQCIHRYDQHLVLLKGMVLFKIDNSRSRKSKTSKVFVKRNYFKLSPKAVHIN